MTQYIVVVDCDAFYASVEELDNPKLKGVAFGVGEGVLTTASYEARKFGCVSSEQLGWSRLSVRWAKPLRTCASSVVFDVVHGLTF